MQFQVNNALEDVTVCAGICLPAELDTGLLRKFADSPELVFRVPRVSLVSMLTIKPSMWSSRCGSSPPAFLRLTAVLILSKGKGVSQCLVWHCAREPRF